MPAQRAVKGGTGSLITIERADRLRADAEDLRIFCFVPTIPDKKSIAMQLVFYYNR